MGRARRSRTNGHAQIYCDHAIVDVWLFMGPWLCQSFSQFPGSAAHLDLWRVGARYSNSAKYDRLAVVAGGGGAWFIDCHLCSPDFGGRDLDDCPPRWLCRSSSFRCTIPFHWSLVSNYRAANLDANDCSRRTIDLLARGHAPCFMGRCPQSSL